MRDAAGGPRLRPSSSPSCHWLSQGNHPDYREIVPEAASEDEDEAEEAAKPDKAKSLVIKIDQIRAIADFVSLTTHRAGYRVLLIHPAEAMHPGAANALLKTLEEPPPQTLIALVSDQPARLLATIRSRCSARGARAPPDRDAALGSACMPKAVEDAAIGTCRCCGWGAVCSRASWRRRRQPQLRKRIVS